MVGGGIALRKEQTGVGSRESNALRYGYASALHTCTVQVIAISRGTMPLILVHSGVNASNKISAHNDTMHICDTIAS